MIIMIIMIIFALIILLLLLIMIIVVMIMRRGIRATDSRCCTSAPRRRLGPSAQVATVLASLLCCIILCDIILYNICYYHILVIYIYIHTYICYNIGASRYGTVSQGEPLITVIHKYYTTVVYYNIIISTVICHYVYLQYY